MALRTITTLHEAHGLSAEEARRGYPVHLHAVVTYYDQHLSSRRIILFLHDATGSIFASVPVGTEWPGRTPLPGTLVDVSGVSALGDFAPILNQAHITILGDAPLPAYAKPVTLTDLRSGNEDGQWVEIEGVVHSVLESATNVTLQIAMTDGAVSAITVKRPGVDYHHLIDMWVHLRGNASPVFNTNLQLTGVHLFFAGLETVFAQSPTPADAFARPIQPVSSLLRFNPAGAWPHRVHTRGAVTLNWPGRTVCIMDSTDGLCAKTSQAAPLAIGSPIDLAGFTALAGLKPTLEDAVFQPLPGSDAIAPIPVTPQQALKGSYDSRLVQIDGRLIGRDLSASDTTLLLASGKFVFRVALPEAQTDAAVSAIRNGSSLRVSGICSVLVNAQGILENDGFSQGSQFSILLRSPQDIVVLQTPSWWTSARLRMVLPFTLLTTIAVAVWVFVLRRRVEQKTRELRESRELYRHMAHHDTLTGLPTRALLHDHLQTALERYRRFKKGVALLMLDVDNFKQVNDSYGHACGDQVLRITAERLSAIIRKTDSVARMGGDEFIVLLNDLVVPGQAELVASKIITALSVPIRIGKIHMAVSVSVGVCVLSDANVDAESLLKRVDAAMYRAKACGRGCFQVFTDDLIATSSSLPPTDQSSAAVKHQRDPQTTPTSDAVAL